jgi:hypothetical protein
LITSNNISNSDTSSSTTDIKVGRGEFSFSSFGFLNIYEIILLCSKQKPFSFSAVAFCDRDDIELYYNNKSFVLVNRTKWFVF